MTILAVATSTGAPSARPGTTTVPDALSSTYAGMALDTAVRPQHAGHADRPAPTEHLVRACQLVPPSVRYAVPTILGALKRHFRDSPWGIRVPRSTQRLLLDLPAATADLTQLRGRSPGPAELAAYLKVGTDDLLAAAKAAQACRLPSLNAPASGEVESGEFGDLVGILDPDYERVDERLSRDSLRSLVAALPLRVRRILVPKARSVTDIEERR